MTGFAFWRRLAANVLALMLGTSMARVLSALTVVLVSRQIGPEGAGQYSSSMAFVALTVVLFSLGLDEWLLYRGAQSESELRVGLSSVLSLKLALGSVWLAALWLIARHLDRASLPWVLVVLCALSVWMEEIAKSGWTVFKVHARNDMTLILMSGFQGLFLAITLWLIGRSVFAPAGYLAGRFLAAGVGAGASVWFAVRMVGLDIRPRTFWTSIRGAFPFAISIALAMTYGRADLAIVALKLDKTAAGVYGPAIMLTNALFLIPSAFYGVMVPTLGRSSTEDRSEVRRVSTVLIFGIAVLGVVVGSGLTFLSRPLILTLYGDPFAASAEVLAVLGGVLILRFPNVALAAVLVAAGWQMPRVGVQALSAAVNVGLNLVVVRRFGVMGVSVVYVISEAVLFLGYLGMYVIWMWKQKPRVRNQESC